MLEQQKILAFLDHFSVITVGESKRPNFSWKKQQAEKLSKEELIKNLNYQGGIIKQDGLEIPPTTGFGLVTGFEDLECVDIDTKVFSTQVEKDDFWNEYLPTLKDAIVDFDKKFALYETRSGGFHILYRSKRVEGNQVLAKLKGHKEAVIETRGTGGYIFAYPKGQKGLLTYFDLQYVSDADRETLWNISKAYNHVEQEPEKPKRDAKIYQEGEITPWDDFNQQTDIWTVIQDEFIIPKNGVKSKFYCIKRHGTKEYKSGVVFTDRNCAYLHSTGTIYPAQKLISPFLAYTYKNHNGNFSEASKDLYVQGFGSRLKKLIEENKPVVKVEKETVNNIEFPLDIFPEPYQYFINECAQKLDAKPEFMGVSLVWLLSVIVGNSLEIEVKKGWLENGVVWISVVAKAGIGKTPSINNIINPLNKLNFREVKKYYEAMEAYEHWKGLSKEEKKTYPEPPQPKKMQFLVNDITLEALVDLHAENDNAVGVFKDELAGWIKDMNKYREGSDLEFWLSCWSGKSVTVNRVTRKSSFIEKPFIPVLGGIQPTILESFSTETNKENGFLDRMLFSFPDETRINYYNENEMHYTDLKWYEDSILALYETVKRGLVKRDVNNNIEPMRCAFSQEGKAEWKRIFNKISDFQNDENENEYLKSMYPKQKSYIPRFALLLHFLNSSENKDAKMQIIDKKAVLDAERLSDYFVLQAKKIKLNSVETHELKSVSKKAETTAEKLKAIYLADPEFNRTKVANLLGVSRQQIIRLLKQLENPEKK
jgi:hypothetical protein